MSTFLITLTPVGKFCFGDGLQGEFGNRKNYFLRSNFFPQQTGLLGFMRHQLLLQNELLIEGEKGITPYNQKSADLLIGHTGFDGQSASYGIIQKISPIFLWNNGKHYTWRSNELANTKDVKTKVKGVAPVKFSKLSSKIPELDNYKAKLKFSTYFQCEYGTKLGFDDIFIRQEQTGIRMVNKQVKDDSFYRQVSYKFKDKSWAFAFYVTLDLAKFIEIFSEKTNPLSENNFCYLGKEKSLFKMRCSKKEMDLEKIVAGYTADTGKYLCISDVIIANDDVGKADFIIGEDGDFNYLVTRNNLKNHSDLSKVGDPSKPIMNANNARILKRGSVIYSTEDLIKELQSKTPYFNIGFNHFVTIQ